MCRNEELLKDVVEGLCEGEVVGKREVVVVKSVRVWKRSVVCEEVEAL